MSRSLLAAAFAVGVMAAAGSAAAQSARAPMTIETFLAVRAVSDPQPSPDGRLLAFTVSVPSLDEDPINIVEHATQSPRGLEPKFYQVDS